MVLKGYSFHQAMWFVVFQVMVLKEWKRFSGFYSSLSSSFLDDWSWWWLLVVLFVEVGGLYIFSVWAWNEWFLIMEVIIGVVWVKRKGGGNCEILVRRIVGRRRRIRRWGWWWWWGRREKKEEVLEKRDEDQAFLCFLFFIIQN